MELLTYTEAAQLAGLTNKTIQRHVKRGTLLAVDTPVGRRIPRSALAPYIGLGGQAGISKDRTAEDRQHPTGPPAEDREGSTATGQKDTEGSTRTAEDSGAHLSPSVPLAAHLSAIDLAKTQLDYLQRIAEAAQQEALKESRARMALELQLGQYQRALSESADSLAEARARYQHLEAAAVVPVESPAAPVQNLESLKTGSPPKRGFRHRLGRWLLGENTG